jgi:predicted transcriptional regulator
MIKIDKSIPFKLHSIIQKYIENKINANTIIQKICNITFNAQQMVVELVVDLVLSSRLYYSSQKF